MREKTFEHVVRDGARLFVYTWLPDDKPRGVVQIVHGMVEHAARYRRLAESLTGAGFAVYAHDQRGHGQTGERAGELGYLGAVDGWDHLVEDVFELNELIRRRHHGLRIALLGHSMGSFVTQDYLSRHGSSVDAAVLSATDVEGGVLTKVALLIARAQRIWLGTHRPSILLTKLLFGGFNKPFEPARTPFDWLSRDTAEVDAYIADPLCGFPCTTQFWCDLLAGVSRQTHAARARVPAALPMLLIAGDRDPVAKNGAGPRKLAEAYRRVGLRDVTVTLYPDGRHELFNELNRDQVTADVIRWLGTRLRE